MIQTPFSLSLLLCEKGCLFELKRGRQTLNKSQTDFHSNKSFVHDMKQHGAAGCGRVQKWTHTTVPCAKGLAMPGMHVPTSLVPETVSGEMVQRFAGRAT